MRSRADLIDLSGGVADGGEGLRLDLEVEASGETDGAKHAELVFGEAVGGVADGAEDFGGEVGAAVYVVEGGGCQGRRFARRWRGRGACR